jgi:hypothetical protein
MSGQPSAPASSARWALGVAVGVLALIAGLMLFRSGPVPQQAGQPKPVKSLSRDETVVVGGVKRPATDVRRGPRTPHEKPLVLDYGRAPKIDPQANPQVASVAETLRTGKFPERVSTHILPKPFDKQAYAANPQAYLNVVEPGRVWQPAQPGSGVSRLKSLTARITDVEQGEPLPLRVQDVPRAPVTFTSFDMGAFQNQLPSITVAADEKGIATAVFTGTPGTINSVNILAASPMTSGQLNYVVNVSMPSGKPPTSASKKS